MFLHFVVAGGARLGASPRIPRLSYARLLSFLIGRGRFLGSGAAIIRARRRALLGGTFVSGRSVLGKSRRHAQAERQGGGQKG
jgi:hypothetical protein